MRVMKPGHVDTPYGPVPGCAECGVIPLTKPHICEHGVTVPAVIDLTTTFELPNRDVMRDIYFGTGIARRDPR